MNKNMTLIGSSLLLLISPIAQAVDNAQTQTRNMSAEKNAGQNAQMQNMQSMTEQERALYQQLNGSKNEANQNSYGKGNGDGSGQKKRKGQGNSNGSGEMNRYGQGNDEGSGSGYGSRGGGGRGRGY